MGLTMVFVQNGTPKYGVTAYSTGCYNKARANQSHPYGVHAKVTYSRCPTRHASQWQYFNSHSLR